VNTPIDLRGDVTLYLGDAIASLREMPPQSAHMCVTSPPYYGLRDYGHAAQIGLEHTPDEFVAKLVEVFREVRRVLRDDGTLWLNVGDSYANDGKHGGKAAGKQARLGAGNCRRAGREKRRTGLPAKSLIGVPWKLAFALQADGWVLRQDIIWHKPNPLTEPVKDRCTKAHEYVFLLSVKPHYYFDRAAFQEPAACAGQRRGASKNRYQQSSGTLAKVYDTRNKRSVWSVKPNRLKLNGRHHAAYPPDLIAPCIAAGCPVGGVVLDPFAGTGTTAVVAIRQGKRAVLCELNESYADIIRERVGIESEAGAA
jgi:DNA modification methylase